ncbi:MAG: NCS2 family permease [Lachnospiraceae bacterium]|jgi:AGZA family xanthine/uracil permease-like MFS transporter|nr:NCS2 family permease [Lachnospiraceae bacterium]MBR0435031.1 NCS2 family permease [Lachnospiraceae bacterium]
MFKLEQNKTTVKTEIIAGLTTFMTMAYIIALNPNLLTNWDVGSPLWNGVFLATCIASAIGMFVMAFCANKPFAMAPGMGLNSFFAIVVGNIVGLTGMSYLESFQSALVIILIEGIIFIILSIFKIREKIVDAIPLGVRFGIAPAIGLMLLNIGLGSNCQIFSDKGGPFFVMRDFFGALTAKYAKEELIGSGYGEMVLAVATMFIGLFVIIFLNHKKVKGSVILGMLVASVVNWVAKILVFKTNPFEGLKTASWLPPFGDMAATTLFKFNFEGFMQIGWTTAITLVITFCIIDMFDTIGTLVGTASRAGMVDEKGNMPQMREALLADAVGTVAGACTGTSTVTTFVESASGVEAGGRTGLTALTTGIMFLACMFISPIAAIIPSAATSSALIYVGILMLSGLKNVNFEDITQAAPVALMLIAMPISSSIGHAIGIGLITYTIIKLITGKAKEVSILTYVLSLLFIIKFFVVM